jgi:hypothetical protein
VESFECGRNAFHSIERNGRDNYRVLTQTKAEETIDGPRIRFGRPAAEGQRSEFFDPRLPANPVASPRLPIGTSRLQVSCQNSVPIVILPLTPLLEFFLDCGFPCREAGLERGTPRSIVANDRWLGPSRHVEPGSWISSVQDRIVRSRDRYFRATGEYQGVDVPMFG